MEDLTHHQKPPDYPWGGERRYDRVSGLRTARLREPLRSADHIRLLLLHPHGQSGTAGGTMPHVRNNDIRCDVYQVKLGELVTTKRPMFAALSYCWGSEQKKMRISCNGEMIEVTANLFQALKWIRLVDRPRLVWVDALCINQNDQDEKSQQVLRMGNIFSLAHVVSYLGYSTQISQVGRCLSFLRRMANISDLLYSGTADTRDDLVTLPPILYNKNPVSSIPHWEDAPWDEIHKIFCSPYFTRLWVFQEVRLAKSHTCQLKQHLCSMHHLKESGRLIWLVNERYTPVREGFRMPVFFAEWDKLQHMSWDKVIDGSPQYIDSRLVAPDFRLVTRCMRFNCKDPRDHIFGVAGLFAKTFPVDYSSNIAKVFTDFTACLAKRSTLASASMLNYQDRANRSAYRNPDDFARRFNFQWSSTSLPSWVPDYAMVTDGNPYANDFDAVSFENLNFRIPARIVSGAPGVLSVHGVLCSKITRCAKHGYREWTDKEFIDQAAYLALRLRGHVAPAEIPVTLLDALSHGKHLNFEVERAPQHPYLKLPVEQRQLAGLKVFGCYYLAEHAPFVLPLADKTRVDEKGRDEAAAQFVAELVRSINYSCARGRRTFLSLSDSSLGLSFGCGPDGLRVGDEIFVAYGCSFPLVIRRIGNRGQYKLIGHCYLRGLMNAEALHLGIPETSVQLI